MICFRALLIRQRDLEGNTLHFIRRTGRRPWIKVHRVHEVPPFDGDAAWFDVIEEPRKRVRLEGPYEAQYSKVKLPPPAEPPGS
jgi:hypothetical protein